MTLSTNTAAAAAITVVPSTQKVEYLMGRLFSVSFAKVGDKDYVSPCSDLDARRTKLEVARTSYWYDLCVAGVAAPFRIVANGVVDPGVHNMIHILQKAQEWAKAKGLVLVGDGKQMKGFLVDPSKNDVIYNMLMEGKLVKESTRFNANSKGITQYSKNINIKAVDWPKMYNEKFLGCLGDGAAITNIPIRGIGEGNAYQWRVTDVFGNTIAGDVTDKGSLTVVPQDVWEHTCKFIGCDPVKVHVIASTECFKYPGFQHLSEHQIAPEHFRIVGVRNDKNQEKSALTMAGTVTCPSMWPIIHRLYDWQSDVHHNANVISDALTGDADAIDELFKGQLGDLSETSMTITSLLFKIPGEDGYATHPHTASTMPKIMDRIRSSFLRKIRKVPFIGGGSSMITWAPIIEEYVVKGAGYFPIKFIGQSLMIAWDAVAKTYGDADGDDICWVRIARGVYLLWRNPVNGINAFSVCIDVDSKATEADIPAWAQVLVDASKEFHYIAEPPKGKRAKAANKTEAIAHHMQDMFNAYFGGAKLGASTQDVYKYSFMRYMSGNPFSVHESCLWAGKLEMEIVKGIKSNNRTMITMTSHPSKIFMALRDDRLAFLPGVTPDSLDEIAIWDLFTKEKNGPRGTMETIADAAHHLNGKYDDIPLVNVTKPFADAAGGIIDVNDADRVTMARITQHIRNSRGLFTDLDESMSLQIKNGIRTFYNSFMNATDAYVFNMASIATQKATTTNPLIAERCTRIIEIMTECQFTEGDVSGSQLMTQYLVNKLYESKGRHGQELHDYKMSVAKDIRYIGSPDGIASTTGLMSVYNFDGRTFGVQCMNLMMRNTLANKDCSVDTMVHAAMRIGADVFQNTENRGHGMFYMCFSLKNIHRALQIWKLGVEDYIHAPIVMEFDEELIHQGLDDNYEPPTPPEMDEEEMDMMLACYNIQ